MTSDLVNKSLRAAAVMQSCGGRPAIVRRPSRNRTAAVMVYTQESATVPVPEASSLSAGS